MKRVLLFLFLTIVVLGSADAQAVRYVKSTAGGANNGTSWANAYTSLQTAINAANANDTLYLQKGTYALSATISITKPIIICGGFAGTEASIAQRDTVLLHSTNETMINAANARPAVMLNPASGNDKIRLDGITLANAPDGGVFVMKGDVAFSYSRFNNNQSSAGGAIYVKSGTINTSHCIFENNKAADTYVRPNYPVPAGWTAVNYGTGATVGSDGWINGQNVYLDKQKAMYFDLSAQSYAYIPQLWIAFGRASSTTPSKVVPIRIYDGTSGTPGALLTTNTDLTMGQIMSDVSAGIYTAISFKDPVALPVSKRIFISVDLTNLQWNGTTKDVLNIISNTNGQTNPGVIWEQQSNNMWYRYGDAGSWNLNASLYIHPFLSNSPVNGVLAGNGGAIYNAASGTFTVINSTFYNNESLYTSGAIFNDATDNTLNSAWITNNTFCKNKSGEGGAIYDYNYNGTAVMNIDNNIIWGNIATVSADMASSSSNIPQLHNNITQGYGANSNNNTSADPLFVDEANGNLRLKLNSPAINAGSNIHYETADGNTANNSPNIDKDLDHNPRLAGLVIDKGAYERITNLVVTIPATNLAYTEGNGAVLIEPSVSSTITDNIANFNTGSLVVSIASNRVSSEDKLFIRNQGTGAGQIGISGSNVTYGSVVIGTFTGGTGTNDLVISFNTSAAPEAVQALLRNITYENTNTGNPSAVSKNLKITVNNGSGDEVSKTSVTVNVSALNDAPVNTVPPAQTTAANTALTFNSSNLISIADADGTTVQVTLTATNGLITLGSVTGLTFFVGSGTNDATMTFTGTISNINAALNGLIFTPATGFTGTAGIQIVTNDLGATGAGGAKTDTDNIVINVSQQQQTITLKDGATVITSQTLSKIYGDDLQVTATSDAGLTTFTYSSSDGTVATVNASGFVRFIKAGTAIITVSQAGNTNYDAALANVTVNVAAKPVTVTVAPKSKTYGDTDPVLTYTVSPVLINGDAFTGELSRAPGENAGNYAILQNTLALNSNYSITYSGADLTISPRAITVTANAQSKNYGEADPALTYTISAALTGTDVFTGSLTRTPGEDAASYPIQQGSLALSNNYTLTYAGASLVISPKAVTVSADAKQKMFGENDPVLTYTVSPALVNGDAFTGSLTRTPGENVATYTIQQGTLSLNANYQVTYGDADFVITPKLITVNAEPKSKTYGEADPAFTYVATPALLNGDAFTGTISRTAGENAGAYAINQGTLSLSSNYQLAFSSADLTINKAVLTATAASQTVCQNVSAQTVAVNYTGFKNGENESAISVRPSVTIPSYTQAGTYQLTPSGGSAVNYSFQYVGALLTVLPAPSGAITQTAAAPNTADGFQLLAPAGTGFIWNTGESSQSITVRASGNYSVKVTNTEGCSSNFSIQVDLPSFSVPNTFSPNGDGINDYWFVPELKNYPDAYVIIVNRDGQAVLESKAFTRWDGRSGGKDLPAGVYFYRIRKTPGDKPVTGWINLVR